MPFYGGGVSDTGVQSFCNGQVVLVTSGGTTTVWADDGDGNAPELTAEDCTAIGAALVALGEA